MLIYSYYSIYFIKIDRIKISKKNNYIFILFYSLLSPLYGTIGPFDRSKKWCVTNRWHARTIVRYDCTVL